MEKNHLRTVNSVRAPHSAFWKLVLGEKILNNLWTHTGTIPWLLTLDFKLLLTTQNVLRAFSYCSGTSPFEGAYSSFTTFRQKSDPLTLLRAIHPLHTFALSGWSVPENCFPLRHPSTSPPGKENCKITIPWSNRYIWCPLRLFFSPFSGTRHRACSYSSFSS